MLRPATSSRFALPLLLALASTPLLVAQAVNNVRVVRISHVEGTVQLLDDHGVVFDQAHANMPVTQGMHLKTGNDGRVEVQFEDGSVARATPNSLINFEQLQRTAEGVTMTKVQASAGLSYYELNNRGGSYSIHFGPYSVSATKNTIFRVDLNQSPAKLAVMRGSVHVETGPEAGIDVAKDQTASLDISDTSKHDVSQGMQLALWDEWNSDRDKIIGQIGARATMARAMTGSPNDPAWSDLDYYGNWYNMAGYGMGWMPAGVSAGWDPFASGYWGYYPAYGYTWISANPWGWLPYHCGAWNYFNGPGWMWFPGNCGWGSYGTGWYPTATVWRCPRNYKPPTRPVAPGRGVHLPPQNALIAVNRDPGKFQFRTIGGEKPVSGAIKVEGKTLHPVETVALPRSAAPLNEGFRAASGLMPPTAGAPHSGAIPVHVGRVSMPSSGALPVSAPRSISVPQPRNTFAGPPHLSAPPTYHAAPSSGAMFGGGSPHYAGGYAAGSSGAFSSHMSAAPAASSSPSFSAPAASSGAMSGGGGARAH